MNLEITIKVPLGQGVSVSEGTQAVSDLGQEPPSVAELSRPETEATFQEAPPPPPSVGELGVEWEGESSEQEAMAEAPPPSVSELGLAESGPVAEPEPPSLQMIESRDAVGAVPPGPEMLEVESGSDTEGVAPPSLEELQAMADEEPAPFEEPSPGLKKKKRTRRAKGKP